MAREAAYASLESAVHAAESGGRETEQAPEQTVAL